MSTRRHAWKWIWLGVAIIILAAFLTIGLAMPEIADGQVVRTPSWGVAMLGLAGMAPGVWLIVRTCRQHGIPSRAAGVVLIVFSVLFYFATIGYKTNPSINDPPVQVPLLAGGVLTLIAAFFVSYSRLLSAATVHAPKPLARDEPPASARIALSPNRELAGRISGPELRHDARPAAPPPVAHAKPAALELPAEPVPLPAPAGRVTTARFLFFLASVITAILVLQLPAIPPEPKYRFFTFFGIVILGCVTSGSISEETAVKILPWKK